MKPALVISGPLSIIGGAALLMASLSCSREPKFKLPPLGQTIQIMPAAINNQGQLRAEELDGPSLHLTVMWGGRALTSAKEGEVELKFFKQGATDPALTVSWTDLETAYKKTGCSNDMIATLDGPLTGTVLVCDGSLKIDQYSHVVGVNDKGKTRNATSWSTFRLTDDVVGAAIQLF